MSLHRYDTKRDENEADIVRVLKANGLSVEPMDKPLDLLVGWRDVTMLAEVKMPRNNRGDAKPYTVAQERFLKRWEGGHTRLVTTQDALDLAKEIKRRALFLKASMLENK